MATTQISRLVSEKLNLEERVKYFTDWYRTKRAVALCLRYGRSLKDCVRKKQYNNEKTQELNVSDLESAECAIIWESHINTSMEELATLKKIKHESTDLDRRVFAKKRKDSIKT